MDRAWRIGRHQRTKHHRVRPVRRADVVGAQRSIGPLVQKDESNVVACLADDCRIAAGQSQSLQPIDQISRLLIRPPCLALRIQVRRNLPSPETCVVRITAHRVVLPQPFDLPMEHFLDPSLRLDIGRRSFGELAVVLHLRGCHTSEQQREEKKPWHIDGNARLHFANPSFNRKWTSSVVLCVDATISRHAIFDL